ncbi:MAG: hypothetical protein JWN25_1901 [Verrucomicrobiales bacterium]|nr:hypothetical protein [Verrucomicrobiales bacterium]
MGLRKLLWTNGRLRPEGKFGLHLHFRHFINSLTNWQQCHSVLRMRFSGAKQPRLRQRSIQTRTRCLLRAFDQRQSGHHGHGLPTCRRQAPTQRSDIFCWSERQQCQTFRKSFRGPRWEHLAHYQGRITSPFGLPPVEAPNLKLFSQTQANKRCATFSI